MYQSALKFHGLGQDLDHDDFFPTDAVRDLEDDVQAYLRSRPVRFVVLYGSAGAGKSTVLLAAHTQLARKLDLAMYEEIGLRTETFEVPGVVGDVAGYLEFLLKKSGGSIDSFSSEAVDEMSRLCKTPRQVRKLAWLALKKAPVNNEKQISLKTFQEIFPKDFAHVLVELRRMGYTHREIAEELLEDPRRIMLGLLGRLPENDDLYRRIGVFLSGLGINFTSNAG